MGICGPQQATMVGFHTIIEVEKKCVDCVAFFMHAEKLTTPYKKYFQILIVSPLSLSKRSLALATP